MQSRWSDDDARGALAKWGAWGETVALRTYSARLLGADKSLVLHGGGNTSAKGTRRTLTGEEVPVLFVKGSGWDLASVEPEGHPAVRMDAMLALRALPRLSDEEMVNALRLALLDASAPTPSVETLLHAYLPARFIDHTHADAVLVVANQPDAERACREVYGESALFIPYVMPGFALAKACAEAHERAARAGKAPHVMVLERHGIFTWGESAKESYERMIAAVSAAERWTADRRRTVSFATPRREANAELALVPRVRGTLARLAGLPPERGPVVARRSSDAVLAFLERPDAAEIVAKGCATPDHVIRTKPTALYVAKPSFFDADALGARLEDEILEYARRYDAYFEATCAQKGVSKTKLAPWPRVVLVPGVGLLAVGESAKEAEAAADVYEHTIDVMTDASEVGTYAPLGRDDLFDMEYWSLEQAKIKKSAPTALAGAVALVTGAASGIGRATAALLAERGAHVVLADRDEGGLAAARAEIVARVKDAARVHAVTADLAREDAAAEAVAGAVRRYGGLDLVVSNAGNAPEGDLTASAGLDALRASLELNLLAHAHVARAAADVMRAQRRGGCLLFNASKSAFNPGPGFGPYAVAKSALVGLMRQLAVDLGPAGVRSNAVNADRVRTALFAPDVVASRARARGLSPEAYFKANLLGREVTAEDVAEAFAYLATARATTGCVVTVDGGNAAAFPR